MDLVAYPATLLVEAGPDVETFGPVKVYRDGDELVAFGMVGRDVVEVARLRLDSAGPLSFTGRTLVLTPATLPITTWTITRRGGCGCSHPLKRFNPNSQPHRIGT